MDRVVQVKDFVLRQGVAGVSAEAYFSYAAQAKEGATQYEDKRLS